MRPFIEPSTGTAEERRTWKNTAFRGKQYLDYVKSNMNIHKPRSMSN